MIDRGLVLRFALTGIVMGVATAIVQVMLG